jgi:hypothetical protein
MSTHSYYSNITRKIFFFSNDHNELEFLIAKLMDNHTEITHPCLQSNSFGSLMFVEELKNRKRNQMNYIACHLKACVVFYKIEAFYKFLRCNLHASPEQTKDFQGFCECEMQL